MLVKLIKVSEIHILCCCFQFFFLSSLFCNADTYKFMKHFMIAIPLFHHLEKKYFAISIARRDKCKNSNFFFIPHQNNCYCQRGSNLYFRLIMVLGVLVRTVLTAIHNRSKKGEKFKVNIDDPRNWSIYNIHLKLEFWNMLLNLEFYGFSW